jgi:hypothetical protein
MKKKDLQEELFSQIKYQLPFDVKLVDVLCDKLNISLDAAYRRLSGKVPLTIFETKILFDLYDISIGNISADKKGKIIFNYNSLSSIDLDFESYLLGLREELRAIKKLKNPKFTISINETPIFQLFNYPHLTRFKFFFWSKSYLNLPEFKDKKFKREKADRNLMEIGTEAHNIYNSIPSEELYCAETLRGILRQLEYYFESDFFEDKKYVLELLDNLLGLSNHMKHQAEVGHKFAVGNEPNTSENSKFSMYWNATYLPDNTYHLSHDDGDVTFFTHNIMNSIKTNSVEYNADAKLILDRLINNSVLISMNASKERNQFFASLEHAILSMRKRVELVLELENSTQE